MRPTIKLGRLLGIDIGLHYSWVLIGLLIVYALAGHFGVTNPQWDPLVVWSLASITALLFFASILVHELSHALVAESRGMSVRSITLFALGGVANIEKESADATSEFLMAIVGPITSVVIGVVFLALAYATGWRPEFGTPPSPVWAGLVWLGYINIALAVFNMIPGYPLDGGRVLRSIVWRITGNMARSTRIAARIGQFIAGVFIVFGVFRFFIGGVFGGLWLALIGWFLSEAATASYGEIEVSVVLEGARIRDVMSRDYPTIDGNLSLRTLAEEYLLRTGERYFAVIQDGQAWGIVTVHDLKQVRRDRWPFTTVNQIAIPFDRMRTLPPDADIMGALRLMAQENLDQLPVMSNGQLSGVISRSRVVQFLQTRTDLKAA